MTLRSRCELLLFAACFFSFAYFNQGGGWNQNARFAEVRAMVEEGRFEIDDYLVYRVDPVGGDLVRLPVERAEFVWQGEHNRLCWVGTDWDDLLPIGDRPLEPGVLKANYVERCASGDISWTPGKEHFHPNKPPGTSFLAVPAYFLIYHTERLLHINPDHWWVVDVNAWLTSAFSVGLAAAFGCVLFFRLAGDLSGGDWPAALGATAALAFGTTFFPFATMLFDHALTASLLIAGFYLLRVRPAGPWSGVLAGFCCGLAVLTNYVAVLGVGVLGLYALGSRRDWRLVAGFVLGGLGPALLLAGYGAICYGSPLKTSNSFQNGAFSEPDSKYLMGMFLKPSTREDFGFLWYVFRMLVWSPYRGLFWFCPTLLLGVCGLFFWWRTRRLRAEALVCAGVFVCFFGVFLLFNGYHGGFSAGPRYLVPAIPFLALPLVVAFARWRWVAAPLLLLSVGVNLLLTATDAQNPVGVGGHARIEGRHRDDTYNLVSEYAWPLFTQGRAWPLLRGQIEATLDRLVTPMEDAGLTGVERTARKDEVRAELLAAIAQGGMAESSPLLLGSIAGPVSVNPVGAFEGLLNYVNFPPGSEPVRWAAFNVGELIWPQSRWSLLPLLIFSGGTLGWAWRLARRHRTA